MPGPEPVPDPATVLANRQRLRISLLLVAAFIVGGVVGAFGFHTVGYSSTMPLAALLILLAGMPAIDDLRELLRHVHLPR